MMSQRYIVILGFIMVSIIGIIAMIIYLNRNQKFRIVDLKKEHWLYVKSKIQTEEVGETIITTMGCDLWQKVD